MSLNFQNLEDMLKWEFLTAPLICQDLEIEISLPHPEASKMNTGPTGGKEWSVFRYFLQWSSDTNRVRGNVTTWYSRSKESKQEPAQEQGTVNQNSTADTEQEPLWIQEMD